MSNKNPRIICCTGGVLSSLGKGLALSSLAALLIQHGYKVKIKKFDPYLNVDPGTMSPYEHGEVFVTADGGETDLDCGHYERFTGVDSSKHNHVTSGKIFATLIEKERRGDYLGKTVQIIPHVTDLIKTFILHDADEVDFVLCEIGGTVGDIESQPFIEAIRQLRYQVGRENVLYMHLTLVPYIKSANEMKTKPTQHSVRDLRAIGIQPHILMCRCEKPLDESEKAKIALFCNIEPESVIQAIDVSSIYEVPVNYHEQGLDKQVLKHFGLPYKEPDLSIWYDIVNKIHHPSHNVKIAIVGKYHKLKDAYKSLIEALTHGGIANDTKVTIKWVNARNLTEANIEEKLDGMHGILVPGGFGNDGVSGKILAAKYARENNIPYFGICLGMQIAVIEAARNILGYTDANSTEFNDKTTYPVVMKMNEWIDEDGNIKLVDSNDMGGTMRLGSYKCKISKDSLAYNIYGSTNIEERHRHRYEVNMQYRDELAENGIIFSGLSPDTKLPEIMENRNCRWFLAVQFHPELKSKPFDPHPIFADFVRASLETR